MTMLSALRKYMHQYDKIIWIETRGDSSSGFVKKFCESAACRNFCGKLIVLSTEEVNFPENNFCYRILNINEQEEIRQCYDMYEFSNHFLHISLDNSFYGGLCNYISTGWISFEEVSEAILR